MESPKIVIIGAGLAGVSAAVKLVENGFENVVILEAENRIGGRINSVPFAKSVIDLGGQWCHGDEGNVVHEMASEHFGFGNTELNEENLINYLSNGEPADKKMCDKLLGLATTITDEYADEMLNFDGSLGSFFTDRFIKENSPENSEIKPETAQQMLELFEKGQNTYYASESWFDISARLSVLYPACEGSPYNTWKDKGYVTVFDYITKKLPDPLKEVKVMNKIQMNKSVTNIKWNPELDGDKIKIRCSDDTTYEADHVICTASLGVLKKHHQTLFTPQLPEAKLKAIEGISFGTIGKVFLEFEKPFWPMDRSVWCGYSFLWTQTDLEDIRGTRKEWLEGIFSFFIVDAHPNVLSGFIAGKQIKLFEQLTDEHVMEDCIWLFEKFLSKSVSITKPISIKTSKWLTNGNFLGSYSYLSTLTAKMNVTPMDLAKPLMSNAQKPCIMFAGEATHHSTGFAHGAIETGWREGQRVYDSEFHERNIMEKVKVIIIGAGLSGISAAVKLVESGVEHVVILEAENRIGGRIHSVPFAEGVIDLGGQWCHGEIGNVVNEMASEHFGFGDTKINALNIINYLSNGEPADKEMCDKLLELINKISASSDEMLNFDGSLGSFFMERYNEALKTSEFSHITSELARQIIDRIEKEKNASFASETWFDISAKTSALYTGCKGNQFLTWKDKGYITVFDYITKKVPDSSMEVKVMDKVLMNKSVCNVKWNAECVDERIIVCCTDGSVYNADHVICTASLGVLKKYHESLFTPQLPEVKRRAIECIGFGSIGKIYLEFEKAFWPADTNAWCGYSFLWSQSDLDEMCGTDKEWLQGIFTFFRVDAHPNVLAGFISGKYSRIFEEMCDEQVMMDCIWLFEKFLSKSVSITKPISIKTSKWLTNENFLGVYSCPSTTTSLNVTPKDLSDPIVNKMKKPCILFAGEATHSTLTGLGNAAIETGWREGQRIVDFYK
ncbi:unnamed protein product [Diamesa serratosioi]